FQELISRHDVPMVDVGHTHYNEVANDGKTIYVATRSTGQVSEGPVGFSIATLDHGVVSWKFKPLGDWPFVMITSPPHKRFVIRAARYGEIHAKIFSDEDVDRAVFRVDNGASHPLAKTVVRSLWTAPLALPDG